MRGNLKSLQDNSITSTEQSWWHQEWTRLTWLAPWEPGQLTMGINLNHWGAEGSQTSVSQHHIREEAGSQREKPQEVENERKSTSRPEKRDVALCKRQGIPWSASFYLGSSKASYIRFLSLNVQEFVYSISSNSFDVLSGRVCAWYIEALVLIPVPPPALSYSKAGLCPFYSVFSCKCLVHFHRWLPCHTHAFLLCILSFSSFWIIPYAYKYTLVRLL